MILVEENYILLKRLPTLTEEVPKEPKKHIFELLIKIAINIQILSSYVHRLNEQKCVLITEYSDLLHHLISEKRLPYKNA